MLIHLINKISNNLTIFFLLPISRISLYLLLVNEIILYDIFNKTKYIYDMLGEVIPHSFINGLNPK